ncbi:hypothetical protein TEA_008363 [Camellia sinensis var. sinensis]|uniref:Protein TIC 214 n=1 Tax=Camellia sinensis var. sinensis TaxID=542762 RepID=A0A4S4DTY3_CAMSN|nr:hypothetical protein TEA_008363 [Camellia sinensis var. sinensis]
MEEGEEGTEKKVSATTGFITGQLMIIPSPILTKKLKETSKTEERDVEIETTYETKGTKQEQEGSTEEDPSPSLFSEEKEDPDKIDETEEIRVNGKEKTKDEFHFHFKETCYKNSPIYEASYLDGNQENSKCCYASEICGESADHVCCVCGVCGELPLNLGCNCGVLLAKVYAADMMDGCCVLPLLLYAALLVRGSARGWLLFSGVGMDFGGCCEMLYIKLFLLDCLMQWVCTSRFVYERCSGMLGVML